jgi:hypothetical protein
MDDGSDYTQMRTAEGRKRLAGVARSWWDKNRAMPLIERWYRTLLDDSAGPDRWLEAADGLVQPPGGWLPWRPGPPQPKPAPQTARREPLGFTGPSLSGACGEQR